MRFRSAIVLGLLTGALGSAGAQGPLVRVRGLAYDSISRAPLAGAFVTLDGARATTANQYGLFGFDSVAPGVHRFDMQHALLDSMGLPGVAIQARITDGVARVTIAVPSFAVLWRAACGDREPPADSGFVYGTIRDATNGREVPGADIELHWSDFTLVNMRLVTGRRYLAEIVADALGEYAVCGVPVDVGLRVQAMRGDDESALIDLGPSRLRILRRDLLIGPTDTSAVTAKGSIAGVVSDGTGAPFVGATIVLDDQPTTRSAADGRFLLINVQPGTHQVEVLGIGVKPQLVIVDVVAGAQATTAARLERVTTLDVVRVSGSRWQQRFIEQFEARKKQGFGTVIDSTKIQGRGTMGSVFSGLPSVNLRFGRGTQFILLLPGPMGGQCLASLLIDGLPSDFELLNTYRPEEIAAVESYPRRFTVPFELMRGTSECGVVAVWTKYMVR